MINNNKLLIVLTVYDGHSEHDDVILRQKVVNFKLTPARAFLAKTAWWAMHSGHEMVTRPLLDCESIDDIEEIHVKTQRVQS